MVCTSSQSGVIVTPFLVPQGTPEPQYWILPASCSDTQLRCPTNLSLPNRCRSRTLGPDYGLTNLMVNACPMLPTGTIAVNLQTRSMRQALKLFSTYRWGSGESEGLRNLPMVMGKGQDLTPGLLA